MSSMDGFKHAHLGPLPHDPRLYKLEDEVALWKKKYNDIFQEQCKTKSLETSLREQFNNASRERDKFKAMVEAQREIIEWLVKK